MRVLSVTVAALLVSAGHPALARDGTGRPPVAGSLMRMAGVYVVSPQEPGPGESETAPEPLSAKELIDALPDTPPPIAGEPAAPNETGARWPGGPAGKAAPLTAQELIATLPGAPLRDAAPAPAQERGTAGKAPPLTAQELVAQLPGAAAGSAVQRTERVARLPGARARGAQEDDRRPPEAMKFGFAGPPGRMQMPSDPQWATLDEARLGMAMDIPKGLLSAPDGYGNAQAERRYQTADGRAKLAIWTQPSAGYDTPASYLYRTFNIPGATVAYERRTGDFAVVSGVFATNIYYIRCNYAARRGSFHCFDLAYPAREKLAWDTLVTRMSRSLRAYD